MSARYESYAAVFGLSDEDDSDFEGFAVDEIGGNDSNDDSDVGESSSDDGDDDDDESDTDTQADAQEWSRDLHSFLARSFSGPPPGPTTKLNETSTVLDFFFLLFPLTLIQHLVQETNRYAAQKRQANPNLPRWQPVSVEEMKCYLGIRLYLSIMPLPEMRWMWSSDDVFGHLRIAEFMSRKRFEGISVNFHANDRTQHLPKEHQNHDKLHLIRPVLNEVLANCVQQYNPHQNCSVDEAMIAFRGRLGFRQYIPSKPTKYGIKVWMRADPVNGYCNEFQVYVGKEKRRGRERGLAARVVTELTERLRGKHHVVNMDNFFTTVDLFESLQQKGTLARGTVRRNRRGLPHAELAEPRLKVQGEFNVLQRGQLSAYAWQDKHLVNLLSSADDPTAQTTVDRKQRDGTKRVVPCPVALREYNKFMRGVDRADQLRTEYPTFRASRRWWVYVFWFLFDVAVANAFILMNESEAHQRETRSGRPKPLTQLEFRKRLAKLLLSSHGDDGRDDQNRGGHALGKGPSRRVCQACKRERRRCETRTFCVRCEVVMCSKSFAAYHGW
ncbi:piggyBac transposable element-derived protein 4-like [Diadema setosum]|uniref:piggyBac transposable element-derived protein 4-like n=1 Tax=Diadema setosum TaxID=31175 RepID=UPI003B3B5DA8